MKFQNNSVRSAQILSVVALLALLAADNAQAAAISPATIVSTWTRVDHPYGTNVPPTVMQAGSELLLYGGGGVVAPTGFSGPYTLSFDVRNPSLFSGSFGAFFGYESNEEQYRFGWDGTTGGTGDFPGPGGLANGADGRVHGIRVIDENANGGDVSIGVNNFLGTVDPTLAARHQVYHVEIDRLANGDAKLRVTGGSVNYNQTFAGAGVPDNASFGFWVHNANNGIYLSNIEIQAVPEPSTMVLSGIGFLGLIGFAVRSRRKAAKANAAA